MLLQQLEFHENMRNFKACRYWSFSGSVDDDVESSSSSCTLLSSVTHIAFKCGAISGRRNGEHFASFESEPSYINQFP